MKNTIIAVLTTIHTGLFCQNFNKTIAGKTDTVFLDKSKGYYKGITYNDQGIKEHESFYRNGINYQVNIFDVQGFLVETYYPNNIYYNNMNIKYFQNGKKKHEQIVMGIAYVTDTLQGTGDVVNVMRLDGLFIDYYENGNIFSEYFYVQGKKNGEFKEFYPNGALKLRGYYYNDVLSGILFEYDEKSSIIKSDTLFLNKFPK